MILTHLELVVLGQARRSILFPGLRRRWRRRIRLGDLGLGLLRAELRLCCAALRAALRLLIHLVLGVVVHRALQGVVRHRLLQLGAQARRRVRARLAQQSRALQGPSMRRNTTERGRPQRLGPDARAVRLWERHRHRMRVPRRRGACTHDLFTPGVAQRRAHTLERTQDALSLVLRRRWRRPATREVLCVDEAHLGVPDHAALARQGRYCNVRLAPIAQL